jgi:hypothetical protein
VGVLYEISGACADVRVIPKPMKDNTPKYNNILFKTTRFLAFVTEVKYFFSRFIFALKHKGLYHNEIRGSTKVPKYIF